MVIVKFQIQALHDKTYDCYSVYFDNSRLCRTSSIDFSSMEFVFNISKISKIVLNSTKVDLQTSVRVLLIQHNYKAKILAMYL